MQLYKTIKTLIQQKKFFPNLEHIRRTRLLLFAQEKYFEKGEVIYTPSTSARYLYFIAEGSVALQFKNHRMTLAAGTHFGEECVLKIPTHSTSAIAQTNVTILMIPKYAVEKIIDQKDIIADEFASPFLDRVSNIKIKLMESHDAAPTPFWTQTIGWLITVSVALLTYMFTDSFDHISRIFLAIGIGTISMMVFKLLDDFIATIFAILLCLGFGVTSVGVILESFSSTSFLTALSFFGIASVIISSGLVLRFLMFLINHLPSKYFWINSGLFLMGGGLTSIIPDLGIRAQMISDTFYDTFRLLSIKPKSTTNTSLAFLFFSSISILGPVFLSSCIDNFIVLSIFWGQYQQEFQWIGWLKAALVPGLFLMAGYALVHMIIFHKSESIESSKSILQLKNKVLGPINPREWTALLSILFCFLGMATTFYHHVPPEIVSFLVLTSLLAFNFITPEEFRSKIPWDNIIFFTGLSGVISTADAIGLTSKVASELSWIAYHMEYNFPIFVMAMLGLITVISLIFPIEFVTISLVIILVPTAQLNGINPWVIAFVILMLGEVWFHPIQKSDYRDFKSYVSEECTYDQSKFLQANAVLSILKVASIFVSIPYWRSLGLLS